MQEKIGTLLSDLKMEMGVFVAYGSFDRPTFTVQKKEFREEVLAAIGSAVDIAGRCGAKWTSPSSPAASTSSSPTRNSGTSTVAGALRKATRPPTPSTCYAVCCDPRSRTELVMVLEPLNWHANHGGVFLERSDQAYAICRAVDSPSCKILFDIYHQQITEGNLIPNIDLSWSEIGYFQSGDNPGRKEPGTGEINYAKVFRHIHEKAKADGRDFVIGMEHGNSTKGREGELALIESYRKVDPTPAK